jgi:mRNA interferase MazF
MSISKGDIFYATLDGIGSEQNGIRPVVIIQNNIGNKFSPTTIVASVTKHNKKLNMPTHVVLNDDCGLPERSIIMLEQIRTIDKTRLRDKIGSCDDKTLNKIDDAIRISFALTD